MIRGVLLDIAGVVYDGSSVIPGAPEAVGRLREAGLPVRFLTNSTRQSKRKIIAPLISMGVDVTPSDVLIPAAVACDWLARERC